MVWMPVTKLGTCCKNKKRRLGHHGSAGQKQTKASQEQHFFSTLLFLKYILYASAERKLFNLSLNSLIVVV